MVVGGEVGLGGGQPAGCVVSMETDIPVEVLVRDCPLLSSRNGLKFLCEWPWEVEKTNLRAGGVTPWIQKVLKKQEKKGGLVLLGESKMIFKESEPPAVTCSMWSHNLFSCSTSQLVPCFSFYGPLCVKLQTLNNDGEHDWRIITSTQYTPTGSFSFQDPVSKIWHNFWSLYWWNQKWLWLSSP